MFQRGKTPVEAFSSLFQAQASTTNKKVPQSHRKSSILPKKRQNCLNPAIPTWTPQRSHNFCYRALVEPTRYTAETVQRIKAFCGKKSSKTLRITIRAPKMSTTPQKSMPRPRSHFISAVLVVILSYFDKKNAESP